MTEIIKVKYKSSYLYIPVIEIVTVGDLRKKIESITGCLDIKLINSGKVLHDNDFQICSIPGGYLAKFTAIGSSIEDLNNIASYSDTIVFDDLTNPPKRKSNNSSINKTTRGQPKSQRTYGFQSIEVLPNLPERDKALEILNSLANDPGVIAVMQKYQWSVGCLTELFPEGLVGVSDVCVMGLNENKGSRILLRLRTDDLRGFRKILSIKKVLYHELAHNIHSEHDNEFYTLMRQIENDANTLNWTKSQSHTTGGRSIFHHDDVDYDNSDNNEPAIFRLGGQLPSDIHRVIPSRIMAGAAAILRITAEEKEMETSCGNSNNIIPAGNDSLFSSRNKDDNLTTTDSIIEDVLMKHDEIHNNSNENEETKNDLDIITSHEEIKNSDNIVDISTTSDIINQNEKNDTINNNNNNNKNNSSNNLDNNVSYSSLWNSILFVFDETIATALSLDTSTTIIDKIEVLKLSIERLLIYCMKSNHPHYSTVNNDNDFHNLRINNASKDKITKCLSFLSKIISNLMNNPGNEKYRQLNKDTGSYSRLIATVDGAVDILIVAGFVDSINDPHHLVMKRDDPGLLHLVIGVLENSINIITDS
eukprot:gene15172-20436_t